MKRDTNHVTRADKNHINVFDRDGKFLFRLKIGAKIETEKQARRVASDIAAQINR